MDSRKRARVEESSDDELEVDRLSGLSDELLLHIFWFLTPKDVVQTSVLSKRWRNLCYSFPWADLYENAFSSNSSFSTFVNYAMLLRDDSNIQKLRFSSCSDNTSNLFRCIVIAIRLNLRVLDLKILQHHQADDINVLPPSLFTCESLTSLILNNILLVLPSTIYLSSLKTLHLISVKFSYQLSTESLFSNSPNLENLFIQNCNFEHLKGFQIYASELKNLNTIQDEAPSSTRRMCAVSAPNLTSLNIHVEMQSRWYYILNNLNSLVEANIHLKKPITLSGECISSNFMIGIFCQLQNAKAITLSGKCLQLIGKELLSSPEATESQLPNSLRLRFIKSKENPFHNLKLMKLKTWFKDEEVHAITNLLKRSPNIETLVIEYNSESSYEENELPLREEKLPSECTLHHLKTVQMRGFGGRKNEVKLLTFLLENAKSLKKMIVKEASI